MARYFPVACAPIICLMILVNGIYAQTACEILTLIAQDASDGAEFGSAVDVDGEVAVVGARYDGEWGWRAGAAYVFYNSSGIWQFGQKLYASNASITDEFGTSVAISGDVAIISSAWTDRNGVDTGSVYVFRRVAGTWIEVQELVAPDGSPGDRFGHSIAISGGRIIASSLYAENGGAAYVFREENGVFVFEQKLVESELVPDNDFGASVAIDGDVVVVGAPRDDSGGDDSGAAYLFRRNGFLWDEEQMLIGFNVRPGSEFGRSVAISASRIVVGAPKDDAGPNYGTNIGAAYFYSRACYALSWGKPMSWVWQGSRTQAMLRMTSGFLSRRT